MTTGLYRLAMPDGGLRLARGDTSSGPIELLASDLTVAGILAGSGDDLGAILRNAHGEGEVPADARILAPVDRQEIWAAGVTYERSRSARVEESQQGTVYDQVYVADRPELFFKAPGWRVRGPGDKAPFRMQAGDVVRIDAGPLGTLQNTVVEVGSAGR